MKVYVASSWRNEQQQDVVKALREAGHEVYDFKHPTPQEDSGFRWTKIDPNWQQWTPEQYRAALDHPVARAGFVSDMSALLACDACVFVLPCGRSASLEMGWACGPCAATPSSVPCSRQRRRSSVWTKTSGCSWTDDRESTATGLSTRTRPLAM